MPHDACGTVNGHNKEKGEARAKQNQNPCLGTERESKSLSGRARV